MSSKKKLSPKKAGEIAHLVAICSSLIIENIDDVVDLHPEAGEEIKKAFKIVIGLCESVTAAAFGVEEVRTTTYIQDMCNKVATTVRKNAKFIPSNEEN
jgi:hypothetical protein